MNDSQLDSHLSCAALAARSALLSALTLVLLTGSSSATPIEIQFTGVNLTYDGSALYDAGSTSGGLADPADADPLLNVDFLVGGSPVGSLSSDIFLDLYIPDVTGIPAGANVVHAQVTPGTTTGFFDFLIGSSPLASEFLLIDVKEVSVTYTNLANTVQFLFGAAVADSFAQNLPFGLVVGDPVTISFETKIVAGSKTDDGSFLTGFAASGTGAIHGMNVPEPSTCLLMLVSVLGSAARRRR